MAMFNKNTRETYEKLMAARRVARAGAPGDRNRLALAGLRVYAKRFTDAGDPDTGKRFAAAADKAEDFLKRAESFRAEAEKEAPDYIGDAALAVGQKLFKLLGSECFTDAAGASNWAQGHLPLTTARQKSNELTDTRNHLAQNAGTAFREFTAIMELNAMEISQTIDSARALRELITVGRG